MWNDIITIEKVGAGTHKVLAKSSGVHFADFLMKEDGYYDYWPLPSRNYGCLPAYILRAMADALDELNEEWEYQIQNDPALN